MTNKKIKIFHEFPVCLLEFGKKYTDGEYILPHLLDENEDYKNYMLQAKKDGRYIIMDNSLHELGQPYKQDRLLYWINELKPNEFIVPDLWEDWKGTRDLAKYWKTVDLPKEVELRVVCQGSYYDEVALLYGIFKDLGYKKVAFSYGASYYNDVFPHQNEYLGKALGRLTVISKLHKSNIIKRGDKIHLLGCSVPQEFGWYEGFDFIESIDTSNPIMAALEGNLYDDYGMYEKPRANLNKVGNVEYDFVEDKIGLIKYNLNKFRHLNGLHGF